MNRRVPRQHDSKRIPPRTVAWRFLVVFLTIVGHFAAQVHSKVVAHELCAEHLGEYCHDHEVGAADPHGHDHPGESGPNEERDDDHEHCPLSPIVTANGALAEAGGGGSSHTLHSPSFDHYLTTGAFLVPPRTPLEYAPKTSPPAQT